MSKNGNQKIGMVISSYYAKHEDEITVKRNDQVVIMKDLGSGWYYGKKYSKKKKKKEKIGKIPKKIIKIESNSPQKIIIREPKRWKSEFHEEDNSEFSLMEELGITDDDFSILNSSLDSDNDKNEENEIIPDFIISNNYTSKTEKEEKEEKNEVSLLKIKNEFLEEKVSKFEKQLSILNKLKQSFGNSFDVKEIELMKRKNSILQNQNKKVMSEKKMLEKVVEGLKKRVKFKSPFESVEKIKIELQKSLRKLNEENRKRKKVEDDMGLLRRKFEEEIGVLKEKKKVELENKVNDGKIKELMVKIGELQKSKKKTKKNLKKKKTVNLKLENEVKSLKENEIKIQKIILNLQNDYQKKSENNVLLVKKNEEQLNEVKKLRNECEKRVEIKKQDLVNKEKFENNIKKLNEKEKENENMIRELEKEILKLKNENENEKKKIEVENEQKLKGIKNGSFKEKEMIEKSFKEEIEKIKKEKEIEVEKYKNEIFKLKNENENEMKRILVDNEQKLKGIKNGSFKEKEVIEKSFKEEIEKIKKEKDIEVEKNKNELEKNKIEMESKIEKQKKEYEEKLIKINEEKQELNSLIENEKIKYNENNKNLIDEQDKKLEKTVGEVENKFNNEIDRIKIEKNKRIKELEDLNEEFKQENEELNVKIKNIENNVLEKTNELESSSKVIEKKTEDYEIFKKKVSTVVQQLKEKISKKEENIKLLKLSSEYNQNELKSRYKALLLKLKELKYKNFKNDVFVQLKNGKKIVEKIKNNGIKVLFKAYLSTTIKYKKEAMLRKKYFNELQDSKGKIRVYVRVRPILKEDNTKSEAKITILSELNEIKVKDFKDKTYSFEFDRIFGPKSKQKDVFEDVKLLSTSVLDGYNVTIFAYGQTGSGKTYTMEGPRTTEELRGLNFRTVIELFNIVKERSEVYRYNITVSIMEIYNNVLYDLLSSKKKKCKIMMSGKVIIEGLTKIKVFSLKEILIQLKKAKKLRQTAVTNHNLHSSRSHCLVSIYCEGQNSLSGIKLFGKLHLIDLAGSERIEKSTDKEVPEERILETVNINKSLSCLGNVMKSIALNEKHTPYRDSTLTSVLKDSLDGNSKVLMCCCLNPLHNNCGESIRSLQFSSRINNITLGTVKRNIVLTKNHKK